MIASGGNNTTYSTQMDFSLQRTYNCKQLLDEQTNLRRASSIRELN